MKKNLGFTLIELLVMIVILSFIITLSTPRLSATYKSMKIKSEAKKLTEYLRFCRNKAVYAQKTYTVSFQESPPAFYITDTNIGQYRKYRLSSSLSITVDKKNLFFYSSGTSSEFTIILSDMTGNKYFIK